MGVVLGHVDFSNLFIDLSGKHFGSLAEAKAAGAATVNYDVFINNIIDFLIVDFAVFLLVRQVNRQFKKPEPVAVPTAKECPFLHLVDSYSGNALSAMHIRDQVDNISDAQLLNLGKAVWLTLTVLSVLVDGACFWAAQHTPAPNPGDSRINYITVFLGTAPMPVVLAAILTVLGLAWGLLRSLWRMHNGQSRRGVQTSAQHEACARILGL